MERPKPLLLIILDGFGVSLEREGNPFFHAKTPVLNEIEANFPIATLQASGVAVGLPWGEAGNSEVGHLTIGAGRAIYHHLPRIINAIHDGSFFENKTLKGAMDHAKKNKGRVHIAGLISSGSVHSYIDHLYALLELAKREQVEEVFIHVFSDGKDAPPKEGAKFLAILENRLKKEWPNASLSSVIGRYYALDRDEQWGRIQAAYELLAEGKGEKINSVAKYLYDSYENEITDEFIGPAMVVNGKGEAAGKIKEGDALIFADFREDSMREITHAFCDEDFDKFPRKKIQNLLVATMTEYQQDLDARAAFPQLEINWPLSRVLGEAGLSHLHIAETQKYAHVTYFLNGGKEKPFKGEERILIPSLPTPHFDDAPQMRGHDIYAKIIENFDRFDVIIANFANADMVGHSGNFQSAVKALEVLDEILGQLVGAVMKKNACMLVTGDHGNIELKRNTLTGEKRTEHSVNPVPLYLVGSIFRLPRPRSAEEIRKAKRVQSGIITDIAPTMLEILGLEKPEEMTGKSLLAFLLEKSKTPANVPDNE